MKDEFLATVSHELRTPLNAVLGWVHLLRTGKLDAPTARRGLESIERNVKLQAQLTGDLLDVSKALTGQLQLDAAPRSLADAVHAGRSQAIESAAHGEGRRRSGSRFRNSRSSSSAIRCGCARSRGTCWRTRSSSRRAAAPSISRVDTDGRHARLIVRDSGRGSIRSSCRGSSIDSRRPMRRRRAPRAVSASGWRWCASSSSCTAARSTRSNAATGRGAIFTALFPLQPAELLDRRRALRAAIVTASVRAARRPPGPACSTRIAKGASCCGPCCSSAAPSVRTGRIGRRGARVRWNRGGPTCSSATTRRSEHDSYSLVGKIQSLDAERGGQNSRRWR